MEDGMGFVFGLVFIVMLFASINNFIKRKYSNGPVVMKPQLHVHGRHQSRSRQPEPVQQDMASVKLEEMRIKERSEARQTYERLAMEKLEVIKTALAMGYDKTDLKDLDSRLEELVGKEKMDGLLDDVPSIPALSIDMMDTDLEAEVDRLTGRREMDKGRK